MNDSSALSSLTWRRAGSPRAEKSTAFALALALATIAALTACQARTPAVAIDPAYVADITALCNSVERSGADKLGADARTVTIALWLGQNIKTDDARAFLVKVQPLVGVAKAEALEAEQVRVGLAACPLAKVWRESAPTPR